VRRTRRAKADFLFQRRELPSSHPPVAVPAGSTALLLSSRGTSRRGCSAASRSPREDALSLAWGVRVPGRAEGLGMAEGSLISRELVLNGFSGAFAGSLH